MRYFKIYTSRLMVLTGLALGACNSQLEIEPAQSISEKQALSNSGNVKAVLIGAYDRLGSTDIFGGNHLRNAELLGAEVTEGEIRWQGTFQAPREIFLKRLAVQNSDAQEAWLESYQAINVANNVLEAIGTVDANDRNLVEGEALFIRSIAYFELARYFGKPYEAGQTNSQPGVPLVLSPTRAISTSSQVSRSTVEEVYTQVINDLTKAAANLPNKNGFFATKGAAQALLARVYLQQGNFAKARDAAHAVIASGNYALNKSYADNFGNAVFTSEDVFIMQVTEQDGSNGMVTFFLNESGGGRGDIPVTPKHLALYPAGDARKALFFNADGDTWCGKWTNVTANKVNQIRLAEMYLIRAECNLRLGTSTGASPAADVNTLRARAGAPNIASVTLEDVLKERRLELAMEGFRIHDIKRLKQSVSGMAYNSPNLVFPIPQRETNANPNLSQNEGY